MIRDNYSIFDMSETIKADVKYLSGNHNDYAEALKQAARKFHEVYTYATFLKKTSIKLNISYKTARFLKRYTYGFLHMKDERDMLVNYRIVQSILGNCEPNKNNYLKAIEFLEESLLCNGIEITRRKFNLKMHFLNKYMNTRFNKYQQYHKILLQTKTRPRELKYFQQSVFSFLKEFSINNDEMRSLKLDNTSSFYNRVKLIKKINKLWLKMGTYEAVEKKTGISKAKIGYIIRYGKKNGIISMSKHPKRPLKPERMQKIQIAHMLYIQYGTLEKVAEKFNATRENIRQILEQGLKYKIIQHKSWDRKLKKSASFKERDLTKYLHHHKSWIDAYKTLKSDYNITCSHFIQLLSRNKQKLIRLEIMEERVKTIRKYLEFSESCGHYPSSTELCTNKIGTQCYQNILSFYGGIGKFRKTYNFGETRVQKKAKDNKEEIMAIIRDSENPINQADIIKITGFKTTTCHDYIKKLLDAEKIKITYRDKKSKYYSVL